jgi:N-acetylglucosamine malate deacetylase 1
VAARPAVGTSVRRLLSYETLSETEWGAPAADEAFLPTVFTDITATLGKKLEAMACYKSQLREFPHPRSTKAIECLVRVRGSTAGFEAAEAFMLIRDVDR